MAISSSSLDGVGAFRLNDYASLPPAGTEDRLYAYNDELHFDGRRLLHTNDSIDVFLDVIISSPSSGNALTYNGSNWVNTQLDSSYLSDFNISSPLPNQLLRYNGTDWVNTSFTFADPGTSGNISVSNGTNWISTTTLNGQYTVSGAIDLSNSFKRTPLILTTTGGSTTLSTTTANTILVNQASGGYTITLPSAYDGFIFTIKAGSNISSSNSITINRSGADTIEGETSISLNTSYTLLTLLKSSTTWYLL